ncbi:MAG: helix-turn-helix domain-containing protein [Bacteroidota bacterium]
MTELFSNTRRLYQFRLPCEGLKDYIEFFWETCFESTKQILNGEAYTIKLFKSWTPTFWINLGPSYRVVMDGAVHQIEANSAIALMRTSTVERLNHPADHLFTVKFHPGALKHLIGIDQTKLSSGLIVLNELLPGFLIEQIKAAANFEQRVALVEAFLLQNMLHKRGADHYTNLVTQTIGFYNDNEMKFNVNELASKAFTSSKTITRYFDRVIGTSPKQYLECMQMRMALPAFLEDRKGFDPSTYGYYDKSHFYKSVTRFTGERIAGQY